MRNSSFVVAAFLATALAAQERLRVQGPTPATVVLGSSARVDLVVEGRGGNPEPPSVPKVDGLDIRIAGPSRQSFTSITPSGMVEQTTTTFQLVLTPQREGTFTLPSFTMQTGTRPQAVPAMQLTAVKELTGAQYGFLDVRLEKARVYVHEPIRVTVDFGVDKTLRAVQDVAPDRTRYVDFEVQAPWLSQMDGAETLEPPAASNESVPVVLNRTLQTANYDSAHSRSGKTYNRFTFEKAFLPTRPGKWTLDAPMLRYQVQLTEGRQGFFGERVGAQTQNYYVYGKPMTLLVLPIPEAGRPQPYFGAVGRFSMAASCDRDVVKVGNSIKLTLAITGSGNFEFLRLPDLSSWEQRGLHLLGQTEDRKSDRATIVYDLTPLSKDVNELPPIAWNWFDTTPGVERFIEAKTSALPIRVEPLPESEALAAMPDAKKATVTPGVDDIYDLKERAGEPMRAQRVATWIAASCAVGPWLLLGFATLFAWGRRRAQADPGRSRSQSAMRAFVRAIDGGADPAEALAGYLADRMDVPNASVIGPDLVERLVANGADAALARECALAIDQGMAARYGGAAKLEAEKARALASAMEHSGLRRAAQAARGALALWLLCAVAGAQSDAGYEAWAKGDYAAAAANFEQAVQNEDDRRLFYALGNCRYRLGELAPALWAYERARLGMPRDAELLANVALVRKKLEIDEGGEPFTAALGEVRDRFSPRELAWICLGLMSMSAALIAASRKAPFLRWVAFVLLLPGALVAIELLWLSPQRPPRAIALDKLELTAEPREGMDAVATIAPGASVSVRSGLGGDFVRVEAMGRSGYCKRSKIGVIE